MGCPYSEEELQEWDSVCNPMGDACYDCDECQCDHWAGECTYDCERLKEGLCETPDRLFDNESEYGTEIKTEGKEQGD